MRTGGRAVLAVSLALTACGGGSSSVSPSPAARVSGTVSWGSASLPEGARVEVSLQDVSSADAGSVSSTSFPILGKPSPFAWSIVYDPAEIDAGGTYMVTARVLVGDKAIYRTPQPTQVITQGSPTTGIALVVEQA